METNQNTAVHPSRAAKLCDNCRYQTTIREPYGTDVSFCCDHPSLPINEVSGLPTITCSHARVEGPCGKDAILFAAPPPRPIRMKVMVDGVRTWVNVPQETTESQANPQALSSGLPQ